MIATPSAFEEKHLQVDLGEVSLHWTEAGEGPPVLLLHGLNDSHRTWREIWPRLSGRRILMLDLPGHGMSSRPDAPYTLDWNATQVARWIEQLDLRDLDVAGHSYGGGVAQWLLLKCRSRIRRLALLSSGGLGREVYPWLRLASTPFLIEAFGQRLMGPIAGFTMARATTSDARAEIALLVSYLRQPGSARAFSRTVRDVIRWRGQTRNLFDRGRRASTHSPLLGGARHHPPDFPRDRHGRRVGELPADPVREQRSLRALGGAGSACKRASGLPGSAERSVHPPRRSAEVAASHPAAAYASNEPRHDAPRSGARRRRRL